MNRKWTSTLGSRAFLHLCLWLFYAAIMLFEPIDRDMPFGRLILRNIVFVATLVPPVYLHFLCFDRFFSQGSYRLYAPCTIAIAAAFGGANYLTLIHFHRAEISYLFSFLYVLIFMGITTSLRMTKAWYDQRLTLHELQARQLQTELELLKSQIDPHFLFNTLNNLFGIVRNSDERVARGHATLSGLLRYAIHESDAEFVPLTGEIEQIERLFFLQRLRISEDDDISVELHTDGITSDAAVPPMLLLPFVENAFKHGISLNRPSYIVIDARAERGLLRFSVRNSNHGSPAAADTDERKIGLKNVKRRLELLYGDRHELNIEESDNEYGISLILPLKDG